MMGAFSLTGRTALVTGSARGLGFEMARGLAAAGATVLLNGRDETRLDEAAAVIGDAGGAARTIVFDVTDQQAVAAAFERLPRVDILVNNVGMRDRRRLFDVDLSSVRRLLEADLVAPFELSRKAARLMQAHGYGRIINITSIAGPLAGAGDASYTAAKGGSRPEPRSDAGAIRERSPGPWCFSPRRPRPTSPATRSSSTVDSSVTCSAGASPSGRTSATRS
jgi:gluconate 5-dehydrogenase